MSSVASTTMRKLELRFLWTTSNNNNNSPSENQISRSETRLTRDLKAKKWDNLELSPNPGSKSVAYSLKALVPQTAFTSIVASVEGSNGSLLVNSEYGKLFLKVPLYFISNSQSSFRISFNV